MSTIDIFSVINVICWVWCVLMLIVGMNTEKTLSKRIDTVSKRLDSLEETNNAKS